MDSLLIIKMLSALAAVILLIYLCLRFLKGRMAATYQGEQRIKIVSRLAVDSRHQLFLLEVDGNTYLLAQGASGTALIKTDAGVKTYGHSAE